MKTAVIYARYSSDSQSEQSIEGQLRVCQQFAKNNEILIVGTYIDRAMTGTNDLRPDFQRMLRDSNKKQWDYVIVYKLDRFSRDKYETTIHKHTLKENGVRLLSAMENIPDSPEGIILEALLEGMNQYYSAELSQKVLRGLKESYIKGQFTGGVQLYGYKVIDKKNVIDEEEAQIVREIFTKYAQGFTAVSIAHSLKERGIRTKKGRYITSVTIYKLIQNSKYIGKTKHGDQIYDNIYPAIIDEDTWKKVQDIRNTNKHAPGRKKEIFEFILSGKLVCGICHRKMIGESGTCRNGDKHYYYNCLSRRRNKATCDLCSVNKTWLEDVVIKTTWDLLCQETTINEIATTVYNRHQTITKQDSILKQLEQQRNDAVKASNNIILAIEQGIITEQTKTRLKELEAQISQYDFDIEQEKQRNYTYLTPELIKEYLHGIICGNIDNYEIKKQVIKTFVREILITNDTLTIVYNFADNNFTNKEIPDNIEDIIEQSEMTVNYIQSGSNKQESSAPLNCNRVLSSVVFLLSVERFV